jgi:hypothetical protein
MPGTNGCLEQMDAWDKEMQSDFSPAGRGHHLIEYVKAQISTGMFRPISEGENNMRSRPPAFSFLPSPSHLAPRPKPNK